MNVDYISDRTDSSVEETQTSDEESSKGRHGGRVYDSARECRGISETRKKIESLVELEGFSSMGSHVGNQDSSDGGSSYGRKKEWRKTIGTSSPFAHKRKSKRVVRSSTVESKLSVEAKERCRCLMHLRSIHEALSRLPENGFRRLLWKDDFGLMIGPCQISSSSQGKLVFDKVITTFNQALGFEIAFFIDRCGFRVDVEELFKQMFNLFTELKEFNSSFYISQLFLVKKTTTFLKRACERDEENKGARLTPEQLSKLPLPLTTGSLEKQEGLCLSLLQRLYSSEITMETMKAGVIHPITFLCTYHKLFSTEVLMKQIRSALLLGPEYMPEQQKIEVLNLCRMWLSAGLNFREKENEEVRLFINDIAFEVVAAKSTTLSEIAEELFFLLSSPSEETIKIPVVREKKSFLEIMGGALELSGRRKKCKEVMGWLRDELHCCSLQLFLSLEAHEVLQELDKEGSAVSASNLKQLIAFYNKLTAFVEASILKPAESLMKQSPLDKGEREKNLAEVRTRYLFFMDLAHELLTINDFPAACAVFGGLSNSPVSRLFVKRLLYNDSTGKVVSVEKREDKKIPKKAIVKLKLLSKIFNPASSFAEMRKLIAAIESSGNTYIPFLGIVLGDIPHINDGNRDFLDTSDVESTIQLLNISKLDLLANAVFGILRAQRGLIDEIHSSVPPAGIQTDIFSVLDTFIGYDEQNAYKLSTFLKPRLGTKD